MTDAMTTFLIRDDAETIEYIDRLAAQEGTSRAALYRRAVRMLIALYEAGATTEEEATPDDNRD